MFVIISKRKWKAFMADRDALLHDVAHLYARMASVERADIHGHRLLSDKVKELKRRIDKMEKELKRKHHGNTLAGKV